MLDGNKIIGGNKSGYHEYRKFLSNSELLYAIIKPSQFHIEMDCVYNSIKK